MATSAEVCELLCFMEITCQSYNFGLKEDGGYVCELSDSDECPVNSRCYSDLEHDTYQCVCSAGFTGTNCQSGKLNECLSWVWVWISNILMDQNLQYYHGNERKK